VCKRDDLYMFVLKNGVDIGTGWNFTEPNRTDPL